MKDITLILQDIKQFWNDCDGKVYCATSGGKDSVVISYLTTLAVSPNVVFVHNPKPETHPKTKEFIYDYYMLSNLVFVPSSIMEDFVKINGYVGQIDGTKRCEFDRTEKSSDVIIDGKSINRKDMPNRVENGIFGLKNLYPIVDWSEQDVFDFCKEFQLPLSEEYDV